MFQLRGIQQNRPISKRRQGRISNETETGPSSELKQFLRHEVFLSAVALLPGITSPSAELATILTRGREGRFVAVWVGAAIVKLQLRDQSPELDLMPVR
jgi:hypothetical protein